MLTSSFIAQRLLRKRQASQLTPSRPVGAREETLPTSSDAVLAMVLLLRLSAGLEVVILAATEVAPVLTAGVVLEVATDEKEAEGELVREVTGEVVELIRGW